MNTKGGGRRDALFDATSLSINTFNSFTSSLPNAAFGGGETYVRTLAPIFKSSREGEVKTLPSRFTIGGENSCSSKADVLPLGCGTNA